MTKAGQGRTRSLKVVSEANREEQEISTEPSRLIGSGTPRISSRLNDLPSKGLEIIDFAASIGVELMPWQKFVFEHALKIKPDGRWHAPLVVVVAARQNGKSTIMEMSILARIAATWISSRSYNFAGDFSARCQHHREQRITGQASQEDSLGSRIRRDRVDLWCAICGQGSQCRSSRIC